MVEGVSSDSCSFANLIVLRQIPGLQPKMSKRNKQGVSNLENRTRPDLVERILAQRARHNKVTTNNQELSRLPPNHIQQQPAAPQTSNADAGSSQPEEENDQARRHEAEMKELADQQGGTAHSRSLSPSPHLPNLTNLPHSQPAAAAKRQVGFAISYLDFTHNATSGSYGLRVKQ
jgi:hypothetical protein